MALNQLPTNVPAQGTVKLGNGHFSDEIRLEAAQLYIQGNFNMDQALRLFRAAHRGWPRCIYPNRNFFPHQYEKLL